MKIEDLLSVAHTYGSPVYVYDADKISSQYQRLTAAFSSVPHLRINYAMKALSNISVLNSQWSFSRRNRRGNALRGTAQYRQPFGFRAVW